MFYYSMEKFVFAQKLLSSHTLVIGVVYVNILIICVERIRHMTRMEMEVSQCSTVSQEERGGA